MDMNELGVLITSHPRQQKFMHLGLSSWEGYPGYILLGYDDLVADDLPLEKWPEIKDTFATGEPAGTLGHFRGELRQLKMGGLILAEKGYKYIFKIAADTGVYRWRNLAKILPLMRKYDMIICGTTLMFCKLDLFNKAMELWHDNLKCGGAELYFHSQIRKFEYKIDYQKAPWWEKVLGFTHIQGEYAINNGINIIETWRRGLLWTPEYKHRDIVPGR